MADDAGVSLWIRLVVGCTVDAIARVVVLIPEVAFPFNRDSSICPQPTSYVHRHLMRIGRCYRWELQVEAPILRPEPVSSLMRADVLTKSHTSNQDIKPHRIKWQSQQGTPLSDKAWSYEHLCLRRSFVETECSRAQFSKHRISPATKKMIMTISSRTYKSS